MAELEKGRSAGAEGVGWDRAAATALGAASEHVEPWAASRKGLDVSKAGDSTASLFWSLTTFKEKKSFHLGLNGISCISVCTHVRKDLRSLGGSLQQTLPLPPRPLLAGIICQEAW